MSHSTLRHAAVAAGLALATARPALAQETMDIGVIKDTDISVVQKMLYPKEGRSELGFHLGWMPFDAYTTTPMAAFTYTMHRSETLGFEAALGGGYSLKNATYKELEGPAYGVAPDAYRYLASALADVQWSPIYAKLNWRGARVVHHDVYGLAGAGLTVEQAILPDHSMAFAPTAALGVGMRLFLGDAAALRVQIRDDFLIEQRVKTAETQGAFLKQNVGISVGYSKLGKRK